MNTEVALCQECKNSLLNVDDDEQVQNLLESK